MTKQSYLTKIRRYLLKKKAVELLGGKCKYCGWIGNIAAFEFHHRNPEEKEFGLSNNKTTNWEKYWKEAQKCDLLCGNCHPIFHSDYNNEQFLKDVANYNGRELISSTIPWVNKNQRHPLYTHLCCHCKSEFHSKFKKRSFCSNKCSFTFRRKVARPSKEYLERLLINKTPILRIGKMFSVSDNSIRKWIKSYGL